MLDMYCRIYLMMNIVLLRFTSEDYQRFLLPVSEQNNGCLCLVWYDVSLIPRITQAWNTVNWGMC